MSNDKGTGDATGMLSDDDPTTLVVLGQGSFGFRFMPRDITFHPVPHNYRELTATNRRRLLFKFGSASSRVTVGLDVFGDIVLGRGSGEGEERVDIDLSNLDAAKLGVSRRHALIRPTRNKLFLIDLESTNGTYVNTIPVGRGMAQEIKDGDTIALAGLSFDVELVPIPEDEKVPLPADEAHHPDLPPGDQLDNLPTDPWTEDKIRKIADKDADENSATETTEIKALQAPENADDQTPDDANPAEQGYDTLPPGSLPYVKSLRKPPTTPVSGRKKLRKPGDEDDENDEDETEGDQ